MLQPMLTDTNQVLDEALALGHRYLVMPYLFEHERNDWASPMLAVKVTTV